MAVWRYNIGLNAVLNEASERHDLSRVEEDCPQPVKDALAAEVEKAPPLASFGRKLRSAKSIAEVNRILEQVYNRADRERVWCGMPS